MMCTKINFANQYAEITEQFLYSTKNQLVIYVLCFFMIRISTIRQNWEENTNDGKCKSIYMYR